MVSALLAGDCDLVKLATFACYDVDARVLRLFDTKVDREASEKKKGETWPEWHSRTWGFGFTYVYTRALAIDHPYDPAWHMGEDYSFLLQAAKAGATVRGFRDDPRDPVVLHVLHKGSTAMTPTLPFDAPAAPYEAADLLTMVQRAGARRLSRSAAAAARARLGLAD